MNRKTQGRDGGVRDVVEWVATMYANADPLTIWASVAYLFCISA